MRATALDEIRAMVEEGGERAAAWVLSVEAYGVPVQMPLALIYHGESFLPSCDCVVQLEDRQTHQILGRWMLPSAAELDPQDAAAATIRQSTVAFNVFLQSLTQATSQIGVLMHQAVKQTHEIREISHQEMGAWMKQVLGELSDLRRAHGVLASGNQTQAMFQQGLALARSAVDVLRASKGLPPSVDRERLQRIAATLGIPIPPGFLQLPDGAILRELEKLLPTLTAETLEFARANLQGDDQTYLGSLLDYVNRGDTDAG